MRRVLKVSAAAGLALLLGVVIYFLSIRATRAPLQVTASTIHPTLSRDSCRGCHAPIAEEWKASFHHRSLTGPFWTRVRDKGFAGLFRTLRVPCVGCHAPANVLDLADGAHPDERAEARAAGVDCVSCHVARAGILGPGRSDEAPHEVIPDPRFRDEMLASTTLCAACHDEPLPHARTVASWRGTDVARSGSSCVDCHMPEIEAPVVAGGPARRRRSHRFPGDKDAAMLRTALNATIEIQGKEGHDRRAVVRVTNDRTGHAFPASGMNSLIVTAIVLDARGRQVDRSERTFGSREWIPGYLDFWPFLQVSKIPHGETREIQLPLREARGAVLAEFRYRDWFAITDDDLLFARLRRSFSTF